MKEGIEGNMGQFAHQSQNERTPGDPYSIAEMPDKETLEAFLRGLAGRATVYFDIRTGTFRRTASEAHRLDNIT